MALRWSIFVMAALWSAMPWLQCFLVVCPSILCPLSGGLFVLFPSINRVAFLLLPHIVPSPWLQWSIACSLSSLIGECSFLLRLLVFFLMHSLGSALGGTQGDPYLFCVHSLIGVQLRLAHVLWHLLISARPMTLWCMMFYLHV